ncbi:D-alanine--D-alanine ligase [uncultured Thiohalocapsa sp.]|uniref:ATP-grasp domain-containing protein n=1 Tax=uncultured Thiohalocapsa sp. TaxID=768990 RepID=UPI0025D1032E|nr:D-alanine--D-alanine ligase [uncultured Thiohalocapsa sp.]
MRHIFVVGLDDVHLRQLRTLPGTDEICFHPLFTHAELKQQDVFPVARLLREGRRRLQAFPDRVDAVIGYWDFPVSTVLPMLRAAVGLPGPSLESVLQCEHKYWSRLKQAEVVPAQVPAFCAVDPFADDPLANCPLDFPFWLKPVKSVLSHLGFRIACDADLREALSIIRARIGRYAEPFNLILDYADLPPEVAAVDGWHCIAEAIISRGHQVTQEGYVYGGEVHVYGTVDSRRSGPAGSSFDRYQYPSQLPASVQARMTAVTRRVMRHIGYDMAPFNIEHFWDPETDRLALLEINSRLSKSHAPLFRLVDGQYHHQVMLDLGLAREPRLRQGRGAYKLAAKFMLRHFEDARVLRVPTAAEIAAVEQAMPGTRVQIEVAAGDRLSSLRDQDSYSYQLATLYIGADSEAELETRYRRCLARLPLTLAPVAEQTAPGSCVTPAVSSVEVDDNPRAISITG